MAERYNKSAVLLRSSRLALEALGLLQSSHEGMSLTEIASSLMKKQPSVHRALRRLLQEGLVQIEPVGKTKLYTIPENKKALVSQLIQSSLKTPTYSAFDRAPPLFMLLSLEDKLSAVLQEQLAKRGVKVLRNRPIAGRHFNHRFDFVLQNSCRAVVEMKTSGPDLTEKVFELTGRIADLERGVIDVFFLVILGGPHQPYESYFNSLRAPKAPKVEVLTVDVPLTDLDEKIIRDKIVDPILKVLAHRKRQ